MEVGNFLMPVIGGKEDILAGMAGKRTDLYQTMLKNLVQQAQYMDEHGYYGMGFTEHHFHVEGEEVSTNPIMLDLYLGMQTKNMKFGQLGNVLPSQNPIRVAEDIAMLDQMIQGRSFAGFARGYQPRWVNTLGQQFPGLTDSSDANMENYDNLKRELYEEHFEIIMKAWENDTFSHQGKHWQIPPADIHWPAHEVTRKYGQGVNDEGILTEIGIAPATYNKAIPDLFQPFSFSDRSVQWAMKNNLSPISIICDLDIAKKQMLVAQEAAAENGRNLKFCEGMGMTREIIVADTDEEAEELARNGGSFIWCNFFAPFGFNLAVAREGETLDDIPNTFESIVERGLVIHGSPDTVNRKLEVLLKELPVDYLWLLNWNELVPQKGMMRHLELLTEKVLPNFTNSIS